MGRISRAQKEPLPLESKRLKKICYDTSRSRSSYTISQLYKVNREEDLEALMPQERRANRGICGTKPGGGQRPRSAERGAHIL